MQLLIIGLIMLLIGHKFNKFDESFNLEHFGKRHGPGWENYSGLWLCYLGLFFTGFGINNIIKDHVPEFLLHLIIIGFAVLSGRFIKKRVAYYAEGTFDIIMGWIPEYAAYAIAVLNFFELFF